MKGKYNIKDDELFQALKLLSEALQDTEYFIFGGVGVQAHITSLETGNGKRDTDFVDDNNLSSSTIKISDGRLKFAQNKQTAPLTLGFLETCLSDIINDEEKVTQIMEYIKQKRDVKYVPDIKRFYNN